MVMQTATYQPQMTGAAPTTPTIAPTDMGSSNPADAATGYLSQIPGDVSPYYDPYISAGGQAMGALGTQYGQLLSDPGAFINQVGSSFKQSPGYQFQVDQATSAENQAAAAGGMVGSPQEQQQLGEITNQLANKDYYNYLGNALNEYGLGLSGTQDINKMGYGASTQMAQDVMDALSSSASAAYSGQAYEDQQKQQSNTQSQALMGSLMKIAGTSALLL